MAKKKYDPIQAGQTIDALPVYKNVFVLVGTHGLPLEIILASFFGMGKVIDWVAYINDALKDGAKLGTIKSRIEAAVGDVYGIPYRIEVMKRINHFFPED